MTEIVKLGEILAEPIEKEFGSLLTYEIIITNERIEHIKQRHSEDYELFKQYGAKVVTRPDYIITDSKNKNTVFMVMALDKTNLNVVVKLVLCGDSKEIKNSVMTF